MHSWLALWSDHFCIFKTQVYLTISSTAVFNNCSQKLCLRSMLQIQMDPKPGTKLGWFSGSIWSEAGSVQIAPYWSENPTPSKYFRVLQKLRCQKKKKILQTPLLKVTLMSIACQRRKISGWSGGSFFALLVKLVIRGNNLIWTLQSQSFGESIFK